MLTHVSDGLEMNVKKQFFKKSRFNLCVLSVVRTDDIYCDDTDEEADQWISGVLRDAWS